VNGLIRHSECPVAVTSVAASNDHDRVIGAFMPNRVHPGLTTLDDVSKRHKAKTGLYPWNHENHYILNKVVDSDRPVAPKGIFGGARNGGARRRRP
jgi:hypothetical protein